jgi:hypothetical protein
MQATMVLFSNKKKLNEFISNYALEELGDSKL